MCQDKADSLACGSEFKTCLGPAHLDGLNNFEAAHFAELERNVRDRNILPHFSYDTDCGGSGDSEIDAYVQLAEGILRDNVLLDQIAYSNYWHERLIDSISLYN